jgi:hypothetical protein
MNYGILIDNILHPAPRAFMLRGAMVTNPKAEHFAALNEERAKQGLPRYYPISDDPAPTPPEGKVVRFNGYAVVAGWIAPQYSFEDAPPPPPRTFSKLRIVAALTTAGLWDSVKQLLIERGLYDLFLAAQDFREDNEYFENGKAALQTALGWTDEQVEEVLAAAEGGV